MRILAITKIFPNAAEPLSSPFNRQQFAALARLGELEVWATIPWFPGAAAIARRRTERGPAAPIPAFETIDGLPVAHPRTPYLPRVGHAAAAPLYTAALAPAALRRRGDFDVVLGSWAYPDGCAAVALAPLLNAPAVVKLHGSDMNVVAKMRGPRAILRGALPRAAGVVAVSRALASSAEELGVPRERIHLVYNGVDGRLFHVRDRAAARRRLGLAPDRRWILYVGNLKREKGAIDLARAFAGAARERADTSLAIVGQGPARAACEREVAGLGDRVVLAGPRPLDEISDWMAACDVVTLPSWHEGTPNVVLEALSCGRRVVATRVGGIPDLITSEALGELVEPHRPEALGAALVRAAGREYDPGEVARLGGRGDWDDSARALHRVLAGTARAGASGAEAA